MGELNSITRVKNNTVAQYEMIKVQNQKLTTFNI